MKTTPLTWLLAALVALAPVRNAIAERDLDTGTFITRDPAGFVDGPNLYCYVHQNPWTKFDPEGLATEYIDGTSVAYHPATGYHVINTGPFVGPGPVNVAAANWMLNRNNPNPAVVSRSLSNIEKYDPMAIAATPSVGNVFARGILIAGGMPSFRVISPDSEPQAAVRPSSGNVAEPESPGGKSAKNTAGESANAAEANSPAGPTEAYNRKIHYGRTPTSADRKAIGVGEDEVADHNPSLVKRYYEGDPASGEKPGHEMTPEERRASAGDRSRMKPQPRSESNAQGAEMSKYSREKKKEHGLE